MGSKTNRKEFLDTYFQRKKGFFHFDQIAQYWVGKDKDGYEQISDRTYSDLDMDEVFMFLDRTVSKVGQQFLYSQLRSIPKNEDRIITQEKWIKQLNSDEELKHKCVVELNQLSKPEAFYIRSLFQEEILQRPPWFWAVRVMSYLSIISVILSLIFPQVLIALVPILVINYIFHYWNKKNIFLYAAAIPQLVLLTDVGHKLYEFTQTQSQGLRTSLAHLKRISKSLSTFKLEANLQSDLSQVIELIVEILRALFLIEPITLFGALEKLETHEDDIHRVYRFVGEIDAAISVDSLRSTLNQHCKPKFVRENLMNLKEVYHPLIEHAVSNSLELNDRSLLLTGSNMSGKSTFIRAVGINAIVGQCLNTCFAKELTMPRFNVNSSIRISDDLMSDKSYFFEEVLSVKGLLDKSANESPKLFLLDEIFKGTNTLERIAAGKAVLEYLAQSNNLVFVATHDLELAELLKEKYELYHFAETIENQEIVFDYKLKPGNLNKTNAIKILDLNGFPKEVIDEANRIIDHNKSSRS